MGGGGGGGGGVVRLLGLGPAPPPCQRLLESAEQSEVRRRRGCCPPAPPHKRATAISGMSGGMGEDTNPGMTLVGVRQAPKDEVLLDPDREEAQDSAVLGR